MPRALRLTLGASAALLAGFLATAPWHAGSVRVAHLGIPLTAAMVAIVTVVVASAKTRAYAGERLRRELVIRPPVLTILAATAVLVLVRAAVAKYLALEVNAWDFSLYFDLPLERTLRGEILYSAHVGKSLLGVHTFWLAFVLVPLYAIAASPWWLVIVQPLAIAAGACFAFLLFRALADDDLIAAILAAAFVLNPFTVRSLQYLFHLEVFYPVALFLLLLGYVKRRPGAFLAGLLLTLSIKEDFIVPIAGFVLLAALQRRWRWGATALVAGAAVFAVNYFVVLPHFSPQSGDTPDYAHYWGTYGDTPFAALGGMLRSPVTVVTRVASAGLKLLFPVLFLPLGGAAWLAAILVPLVVYGSADLELLRSFGLYYSMPVLPLVFAAIPAGIDRIAGWLSRGELLRARRIAALLVLAACTLAGRGYELDAPRSSRKEIRPLLEQSVAAGVIVQGSLMPHAGYESHVRVLDRRRLGDRGSAFLLCESCVRYPFSNEELDALISSLREDPGYQELRRGELSLFEPRVPAGAGR